MMRSTVPVYLASAAALTFSAAAPVTGVPKPGGPPRPNAPGMPAGAPDEYLEREPEPDAMADAPKAIAASAATPATVLRIVCDIGDLSTRLMPKTLPTGAVSRVGRSCELPESARYPRGSTGKPAPRQAWNPPSRSAAR